jgi:hypothetical protein
MLWKLVVARYGAIFVSLTRAETLLSSHNGAWLGHVAVFVFCFVGTTTCAFPPSQPGNLNGRNGATMTWSRSYSGSRKDTSDQFERLNASSPKSEVRKRRRTKPKMRLKNSTTSMVKGYYLPYDLTIQALRTYSSTHADLVLPRRFVVPDHDGKLHGHAQWTTSSIKSFFLPDMPFQIIQVPGTGLILQGQCMI